MPDDLMTLNDPQTAQYHFSPVHVQYVRCIVTMDLKGLQKVCRSYNGLHYTKL